MERLWLNDLEKFERAYRKDLQARGYSDRSERASDSRPEPIEERKAPVAIKNTTATIATPESKVKTASKQVNITPSKRTVTQVKADANPSGSSASKLPKKR